MLTNSDGDNVALARPDPIVGDAPTSPANRAAPTDFSSDLTKKQNILLFEVTDSRVLLGSLKADEQNKIKRDTDWTAFMNT
ncbi:hypothetical protein TTRE_0000814701 [Trichuris trichiura]|uniref:Uncharacterized protein n=1 Tax=Trichuris trichiura TaxID=36087 RepID=A0A077ZHG2_TRITR|nr:hypothetical protein TTRE_0000814701 [Trichuris trichiura]